jgi:hypothetical protein
MKYTQAEKEKIHANLDAIKAYIEREIQPNITGDITVDFGEMKTYYHGDREREFHLYVRPNRISGRSGGLGLEFEREYKSQSLVSTVYAHMDYAIALLKEWHNIKATLHTAVAHENETRNMINNFHI